MRVAFKNCIYKNLDIQKPVNLKMLPWRNEAVRGIASQIQIATRLPGYCWAIIYDQMNGLAISDGDFCCNSHCSAEALADIWAPPPALNLEAKAIWDIFNSNLIFLRRESRSRGVSNSPLAVLVLLPLNWFYTQYFEHQTRVCFPRSTPTNSLTFWTPAGCCPVHSVPTLSCLESVRTPQVKGSVPQDCSHLRCQLHMLDAQGTRPLARLGYTAKDFHHPLLRIDNLLEGLTEFRKMLYLLLLVSYKGYYKGHKWTATWSM